MAFSLTLLLDLFVILLTFFIITLLIFLLARLFDKSIAFRKILLVMFLYAVVSTILYQILISIWPNSGTALDSLKLSIGLIATYLATFLLFKRILNFGAGKSLMIFLCAIIFFPVVYSIIFSLETRILYLPAFISELENSDIFVFSQQPVYRIMSAIKYGLFTANTNYIRDIILLLSF